MDWKTDLGDKVGLRGGCETEGREMGYKSTVVVYTEMWVA